MMKMSETEGLSFDDVLIVPRYSEVRSRSDVDLSVKLGRLSLDLPFIAANMASVCEEKMVWAMAKQGAIGVVHRNVPLKQRFMFAAGQINSGVAFGVNEDLDEVIAEANKWRIRMMVLDIAHGHSLHALRALSKVRDGLDYDATLVGGNVATATGVRAFADAGADVVKVGIGPGSVCSTRVATGVGVPQLTAISECADAADVCGVQIIADGGIRSSGDAAKALAAGADAVMLGSMLAGTDESPGNLVKVNWQQFKEHYGMASAKAGSEFVEGVSGLVPLKGPVAGVLKDLRNGLSSACSYVGAHNLDEFRMRVEFMRVSNASLAESTPHSTHVTHQQEMPKGVVRISSSSHAS